MTLGIPAPLLASLGADNSFPVYFVSVGLTPALYIWTGVGATTQNDADGVSRTWTGIGDFGVIHGLGTTRALRATRASLSLVGIPGSVVSGSAVAATRAIRYQGKEVDIYISTLSPSSGTPLFAPAVIWSGYADAISMSFGEEVRILLPCENRVSRLRRTNGLRMTTESHNLRLGSPSPRDLFFEPRTRLMGKPKAPIQ